MPSPPPTSPAWSAPSAPPGSPSPPQRAAAVTLAVHAAISHLLAGGAHTLAAAGLTDLGVFARDLLSAVYGQDQAAAEDGR
jgi:hypothetical protein